VTSLARPGGRVTGISDQHSELGAKRLELLRETIPSLTRVAVLHVENPVSLTQLRDTKAAASVLRLTVVPVRTPGPRPEGIDDVFATIKRERAEALSVLPGAAGVHAARVADLAVKSRIAVVGTERRNADADYLMAYIPAAHGSVANALLGRLGADAEPSCDGDGAANGSNAVLVLP
jgi:putative ABC transport system substrate-binding protein